MGSQLHPDRRKIKLGDICKIVNGYAFKSKDYVDDGIRIIRIANVQKGYISDADPKYYPLEKLSDTSAYILNEGDLLISLTGNVGRVAMLEKDYLPAALNQRVGCLRLKPEAKIQKRFLFHLLNSDWFERKCIQNSKGIAQLNMSTRWLKTVEIPLYLEKDQQHLVELFDSIQNQMGNIRKQLEKLDALVKSRFIEMFGDPADNPFGWNTAALTDLGVCKNGMNFRASDSGYNVACLGVADFKDRSVIDDMSLLGTVNLDAAPSDNYLLKNGDIVFVRSNGNKQLVGRCLAVYPGNQEVVFSGFCIRLRLNNDQIRVPFLLWALKQPSMRRQMFGRGANVQNLNQKILSNVRVPVPPIALQEEFLGFATQVDKSKSIAQRQIEKLQMLYDSLAQEYFGD